VEINVVTPSIVCLCPAKSVQKRWKDKKG
jgi:hypothetical protein